MTCRRIGMTCVMQVMPLVHAVHRRGPRVAPLGPLSVPNGEDRTMMESIDGGTDVICRQWYAEGGPRERMVSRAVFSADMLLNKEWDEVVHAWSGTDRTGQPLTVIWLPSPRLGSCTLYAYEITDGA